LPSPVAMAGPSAAELAGFPPQVQQQCCQFIARLRRRQLTASQDIARKTGEILRMLVATQSGKDVSQLIESIKRAGAVLIAAQPHELVVGNMVRRVLAIIREETLRETAGAGTRSGRGQDGEGEGGDEGGDGGGGSGAVGPSLVKMFDAPDSAEYLRKPAKELKGPVLEALQELFDELSSAPSHISEQALEHIHAREVILTHGHDQTVELFLKAAHKKRSFEVIVAETAPGAEGHQMATSLAAVGIETTLIADAAVFAMMARVNKVIVGAHAVMANGGVIATASCQLLALAAQHHAVPLVVCAAIYKLTPLFPSGPEQFNTLFSPEPLVPYAEGLTAVHVPNPAFDYVPPELVSLLITNIGGNHPSYVYRLLQEYYHPDDYAL